jgi:acyl-coenzyme A synthetase/AMP-(fatty) acid ligase
MPIASTRWPGSSGRKDYFAVPDLPKNNYGKVLKTALRERLKEGMP